MRLGRGGRTGRRASGRAGQPQANLPTASAGPGRRFTGPAEPPEHDGGRGRGRGRLQRGVASLMPGGGGGQRCSSWRPCLPCFTSLKAQHIIPVPHALPQGVGACSVCMPTAKQRGAERAAAGPCGGTPPACCCAGPSSSAARLQGTPLHPALQCIGFCSWHALHGLGALQAAAVRAGGARQPGAGVCTMGGPCRTLCSCCAWLLHAGVGLGARCCRVPA